MGLERWPLDTIIFTLLKVMEYMVSAQIKMEHFIDFIRVWAPYRPALQWTPFGDQANTGKQQTAAQEASDIQNTPADMS